MGSIVEINDTLQISREQGFPDDLDLEKHRLNPYSASQFADRVFAFKDKPGIRFYHSPPVRNFLVENKNGKWIYWGLIHVIETTHDHINKVTSGRYKIIYINSPEEMDAAHDLVDRNPDTKL